MVTTKPYFLRAVFEWCVDQGFTPYLTVAVDARTRVPREYVREGQIVLNVGPDATHQLLMGNEEISFQARFNGVAFSVAVPVDTVVAIYAKENGQGMAFEPATAGEDAGAAETDVAEYAGEDHAPELPPSSPSGRPRLTRVK
jgi:stringent starvation protein B